MMNDTCEGMNSSHLT